MYSVIANQEERDFLYIKKKDRKKCKNILKLYELCHEITDILKLKKEKKKVILYKNKKLKQY